MPEDICTDKARCFLPYMKEVYRYEYEEDPDYKKLKHMLVKIVLSINKVPSIIFDWSRFSLSDFDLPQIWA